ncbi:MAG: hypothetical protein LBS09_07060 [Bacteroidales bacterium]|nr:hypothetical protein [Bacteroidales bacterium]
MSVNASFFLNFETTALIYDGKTAVAMRDIFMNGIKGCAASVRTNGRRIAGGWCSANLWRGCSV